MSRRHAAGAGSLTSVCSVNPLMGLGHKIHRLVEQSAEPKKVAVIGGGPAGMRAAIYAAQRGHDVTLYEKSGQLGGQLFHGDYFPFKWPIKNFKNWLIYELGKSGAKVVMNTEPTRQMIVAGGYDVVLAATGAKVNIPNIPGLKDENGKLKPEYMSLPGYLRQRAGAGQARGDCRRLRGGH